MWWSRGQSGGCMAWRAVGLIPSQVLLFFLNSCVFVGKIMQLCRKNHVSLLDNSSQFVGKIRWTKYSIVLDNSRQFVRKIPWTKVQCWIIPVSLWEKITGLFTSICRGTVSHNVYLTENSPKLKTVYIILKCVQCSLYNVQYREKEEEKREGQWSGDFSCMLWQPSIAFSVRSLFYCEPAHCAQYRYYSMYCPVPTKPSIQPTVLSILPNVPSILPNVLSIFCPFWPVYCPLCPVSCPLYTVFCPLCPVYCPLCPVYCPLCQS